MQQPQRRRLCSMRLRRGGAHFEQSFRLQSWLIASVVSVVDNSSSYELKRLFLFFKVYFGVELNKITKSVLLYTVKWHNQLCEVDYQYTTIISCTSLFLMLPTKNYKCAFEFVNIFKNTVSFFTPDTS